jgi:hypothetical protein
VTRTFQRRAALRGGGWYGGPSFRYAGSQEYHERGVFIARAHQMMGNLPGALAVCAERLPFDLNEAELTLVFGVASRRRV